MAALGAAAACAFCAINAPMLRLLSLFSFHASPNLPALHSCLQGGGRQRQLD
jgi:hypothetical protein